MKLIVGLLSLIGLVGAAHAAPTITEENWFENKNYAYFGNAESGSGYFGAGTIFLGWQTYNDGASATPVDCTGGSIANSALSVTTTNPLQGVASFLISHTGANQGSGHMFPFTLNRTESGKRMVVRFKYWSSDNGGSWLPPSDSQDSIWGVYLYSTTQGALVPLTTNQLTSNTSSTAEYEAYFDVPEATSTAQAYRLCIHSQTTSANNVNMRVDDLKIMRAAENDRLYSHPMGFYLPYGSGNRQTVDVGVGINGTETITKEHTIVREGTSVKVVTAATSGHGFKSQPVTIPSGTNNCLARIYYNTSATNLDFKVKNTAGAVLNTVALPANSTGFRAAELTFVCSDTSTKYRFEVATNSASAATFYIDDALIGKNTNIGTVAQAKLVGEIIFGTNCEWSSTTTSDYANFSEDSSCSTTVTGSQLSVVGNIRPAVTVSNMEPGRYVVRFTGGIIKQNSNNAQSYFRWTDGSTVGGANISRYASSQEVYAGSDFTGEWTYTGAQSSKTFEIQNFNDSSGSGRIGQGAMTSRISVYYYPTSEQTVVKAGQSVVAWSGYHANDCSWGATSSTSFTTLSDTGCTLTEQMKKGDVTVASVGGSNVRPALSITTAQAKRLKVCATVSVRGNTVDYNSYIKLMADGSQNGDTAHHTTGKRLPLPVCIEADFSPSTARTIEVYVAAESGSTITIESPSLMNPVAWSIEDVSEQQGQPQIVNSVTHRKANVQRIVTGMITSAGAINYAGTGDWSSSKTGTGAYDITFSPAFANDNYVCTANPTTASFGINPTNASSSLVQIYAWNNSSGAYADVALKFICIGDQ